MCYDEGTLQAYYDSELDPEEALAIKVHLDQCPRCLERLVEIEQNASFAALHLTTYKKQLDRIEPLSGCYVPEQEQAPSGARKIFREKGVLTMLRKYKKIASVAAVAACLGVALSFAPVRTVAAEILTMFRVQNVESAGISFQDLNQIQQAFRKQGAKLDLQNLGKVENEYIGNHRQISWDDAQKDLPFQPVKPAYLPEGLQFNDLYDIQPGLKVNFALDVDNVNNLVEQLGGKHMLPEALDAKKFTLTINESLQCSTGRVENNGGKYINVIQTTSPEMNLPEGVDVDEVRKAILDLPIIPADVQQKLAALKDWQNTLYVPQPANGSTEEVDINGAKGVLVKENGENNNYRYSLMWQKDGVLYIVDGNNVGSEELMKVANSMK